MKWPIPAFALGLLTASLPAFASTASDNIIWSAKPIANASAQPECTVYSGRQVSNASDATANPLVKTLKVVGTLAGLAAVSAATKASSVEGPNPCRRF